MARPGRGRDPRWRGAAAWAGGALLALGLAGGAARADPAAIADLGAPPGAVQTVLSDTPLDSYALPVGQIGAGGGGMQVLQGRVVRSAWALPQGSATTTAALATTRARLADLGYEVVWECQTRACGGFDFRFAIELIPAPAMRIDTADFGQISARRGTTYLSVLISRSLDVVQGQVVAVDTGGAPATTTAALAPPAAPPLAGAAAPGAAALYSQLIDAGHVVLDGVVFDSSGATLSAASGQSLDRIAAMLLANPKIAVAIVGHSDGEGAMEPNMALSRQRAEAVRSALIARKVAPDRLDAQGVGWLSPRAPNTTEAGRALNRRVELVLR